jgi:hypothetical protein
MHTILVLSVVYVSSVLIAGSLIVVSTKRNRVPLVVITIVLPFLAVVSVVSTIADLMRGKAKLQLNQETVSLYCSAAATVQAKRVEMFGGSIRHTKVANALRERYCIHLTKSADSITNWIIQHRGIAA